MVKGVVSKIKNSTISSYKKLKKRTKTIYFEFATLLRDIIRHNGEIKFLFNLYDAKISTLFVKKTVTKIFFSRLILHQLI